MCIRTISLHSLQWLCMLVQFQCSELKCLNHVLSVWFFREEKKRQKQVRFLIILVDWAKVAVVTTNSICISLSLVVKSAELGSKTFCLYCLQGVYYRCRQRLYYSFIEKCFYCVSKKDKWLQKISRVSDQNGVSYYISCLRYTILAGNPRFVPTSWYCSKRGKNTVISLEVPMLQTELFSYLTCRY